ncbi:MAG: RNA polymerase subunit sigma-70, partial [Gemmataceae bacterium]|nr:RNA polymerase subunit sigma-70 [Gemmataceae bacterium]
MDWKNDEVVKTLIEKAKQTGTLTYDEVTRALPADSDPDRLSEITDYILDQTGVSLVDDEDAEEVPAPTAAVVAAEGEVAPAFEDSDGDGRHIDDPVRMYLTQMGQIDLLNRKQEVQLAMKIELTRRRFRRKVL